MKILDGFGARRRDAAPVRVIALLALALGWAAAQADDGAAALQRGAVQVAQAADRGSALYESRCEGCHDRSVHQRSARVARDYAGVREGVVRWDRELGALWRPDEIDAVTRYLNSRYYRFPCTGPGCAPERAQAVRLAPTD